MTKYTTKYFIDSDCNIHHAKNVRVTLVGNKSIPSSLVFFYLKTRNDFLIRSLTLSEIDISILFRRERLIIFRRVLECVRHMVSHLELSWMWIFLQRFGRMLIYLGSSFRELSDDF